MKVTKTKEVTKVVNEVVESYTICDKCNEKIVTPRGDAYDFNFQVTEGTSWPEGGGGKKWDIDLCRTCAADLIKTLKDSGYRITESEWDY